VIWGRRDNPRARQREGPEDAGVVAAYDRVSRGIILRVERWLALRALGELRPSGRLVDVGSGPGYLAAAISRRYPALRVTGVDINRDMLTLARKNFPPRPGGPDFLVGDALCLPLAAETADIIISTGAFHHWMDGPGSLGEFHRVLAPGGRLLILDVRRDIRRYFYLAVRLAQMLMPSDIRRVNGAAGSIWASYTPLEMAALMSRSPFRDWRIMARPVWMMVRGKKG